MSLPFCTRSIDVGDSKSPGQKRRQWRQEEIDIRTAILPFLAAENDVQADFLKERQRLNEAELMKDVGGWEVGASVYKTRYMAPMALPGMTHDLSKM